MLVDLLKKSPRIPDKYATLQPIRETDRIVWVDIARGICMVLVVVMHFDEVLYGNIVTHNIAGSAWDFITSAARPARIPTFFLISGILASSSLNRPLHSIADKRMYLQYYVFTIWSAPQLLLLYYIFTPFDSSVSKEFFQHLVLNQLWPSTTIWFLYALVIFFAISYMFRSKRFLALAFGVCGFFFAETFESTVVNQMLRSLPFYLVGSYFPETIKNLAKSASIKSLLIALILYPLTVIPIFVFGPKFPGVWLPASICGAILIIIISKILSNCRISKLLQYIGKRTLPIYVMHSIAIQLLYYRLIGNTKLKTDNNLDIFMQFVFPLLGNAIIIFLCVWCYYLFLKMRCGWLFALPAFLKPKNQDRR